MMAYGPQLGYRCLFSDLAFEWLRGLYTRDGGSRVRMKAKGKGHLTLTLERLTLEPDLTFCFVPRHGKRTKLRAKGDYRESGYNDPFWKLSRATLSRE